MDWQVLGTLNAAFHLHSVHSVGRELCIEKCHGGNHWWLSWRCCPP